ncbi:MAG: hypothetical protein HC769_07015 [Cyanobacteria bacterium CRU_2_1]|nr:hypothetical protein [Cyanobacteria bacterium RU_5_0]NJR58624.1 hypothetical protein [Cyanobacteria bacterium CRU_2_1]
MVFILVIVVALVAWALHLMQEAIQHREFSLMLAGFLVSSSAAALMAVYFLMGNYVGYMSDMTQRAYLSSEAPRVVEWASYHDALVEDLINLSLDPSSETINLAR